MSKIGDLMNAHGETMAHAKRGIKPSSGGKIQAFNARRSSYKPGFGPKTGICPSKLRRG